MAFTLVPDRLWKEIQPILPPKAPKPKGGRPRVPDRACLTGIVYVLRTGMPWRFVPQELGCGSGVTGWRRLQEWTQASVCPRLHKKLFGVLGRRGRIDASLALLDVIEVEGRVVTGDAMFGQRDLSRKLKGKKGITSGRSRSINRC